MKWFLARQLIEKKPIIRVCELNITNNASAYFSQKISITIQHGNAASIFIWPSLPSIEELLEFLFFNIYLKYVLSL